MDSLLTPSAVGPLTICAEDGAIVRIAFGEELPAGARSGRERALLGAARRQLEEYFAGKRRAFDLPLRAEGTPFQRECWAALCAIPYGETRAYGELARAIGRERAVRAVGGALHRNPIPIIIPCHRVLGADGSLTGFAGGLEAKELLLALEARGSQA